MAVNLNQIQTQQERAILKAFMSSVQSVKDQAVISEIVRLIELGQVEAIVDLLQLEPATFRPLENATLSAYEVGGSTGAAQIGRIPTNAGTLVARFNVRNPRAEAFIRDLSSRKIVEIAEETKEVVRTVLRSGLAEGANPRSTALDLVGRIDPVTRARTGGHIGLTSQQSQWIVNARKELEELNPNYLTRALRDKRFDGVVKKAIESGKPLNQSQISRMITRMEARALRSRAEAIAQTESLQALSEGQNEAIKQALETAELEDEFTRKFWVSTNAGKEPRIEHAAVEVKYKEGLPIDEYFIVGGEPMLRPRQMGASAENIIRCKCYLRYRVNFAGQAAKTIQGFG